MATLGLLINEGEDNGEDSEDNDFDAHVEREDSDDSDGDDDETRLVALADPADADDASAAAAANMSAAAAADANLHFEGGRQPGTKRLHGGAALPLRPAVCARRMLRTDIVGASGGAGCAGSA